MIPIIFLRPPNNTTACYIGLFCKILKCSLGIDFLISPLTTSSLSFSPSFLLVLLLLQIDMSHCCRLTLSLESIIVSYFSFLRAVFSLLLSESLEAL